MPDDVIHEFVDAYGDSLAVVRGTGVHHNLVVVSTTGCVALGRDDAVRLSEAIMLEVAGHSAGEGKS